MSNNNHKSIFTLIVKSNGTKIGEITPDQFRRAEDVPPTMFLQTAIQKWNDWKAEIGEPERIEISF